MRPSRIPKPNRPLPVFALALALGVAATASAPSHADYKDSYLEGVDAAGAGDWQKAGRAMEQAIAEEPRESERIRFYGMRFGSYVPYYYLGVARSQLGDCEGALEAWEVSTSQGVIQELEEHETLQRLRGGCEERLAEAGVEDVEVAEEEEETPPVPQPQPAPPEPALPEPTGPDPAEVLRAVERAEAAIGEAARQTGRLGQLREDPDLSGAWERAPSLAAPAGEGERLLARARSRLAAGRAGPDLEALEEARGLAVEAQEAFSGVIRRAEARREEILQERAEQAEVARREAERQAEEERRRAELRDRIAAAAREADALLSRTRGPTQGGDGELQEVGRTRGALEQALARAEELEGLDSVADLETFRDDLSRAAGRYREALDEARRQAERAEQEARGQTPTGPPEALRTAARAYFNGDYWEVLEALSGQELEDEDVAAQALLFRAAARYALYLLSGEEEESLAEAALEDLASCRRLAPDLTPDPAAFSPRFVAFFEREE